MQITNKTRKKAFLQKFILFTNCKNRLKTRLKLYQNGLNVSTIVENNIKSKANIVQSAKSL